MYETTPGLSIGGVAEKTGISKTTLAGFASRDKWRKGPKCLPPMEAEAQAVADRIGQKLEDLGPEASAEQRMAAVEEEVKDVATDMRAQLLDRHRREWAAPRAMSAEAVQMRKTKPDEAFNRAKLAKITAETLKIVQDGERKAWGLDVGELPAGAVVVIERDNTYPNPKQVN